MAIKTVIFDIGNVLANFCWEKFFRSFDLSEEMFQRLAKATVYDSIWDQFDKGVLSEDEMLALFIQKDTEIEPLIRQVFQNISGMIEVYDYTYDWIHELQQKGYQVLILSNFSEKCYHRIGLYQHTDGMFQSGIISPVINCRKQSLFLTAKLGYQHTECCREECILRNRILPAEMLHIFCCHLPAIELHFGRCLSCCRFCRFYCLYRQTLCITSIEKCMIIVLCLLISFTLSFPLFI